MAITNDVVRKENLKIILDDLSKKGINNRQFSKMVGTNAAYISQILSNTSRGNIGEALARKIESAANKPIGWLDQNQEEIHFKKEVKKLISSISGILREFNHKYL